MNFSNIQKTSEKLKDKLGMSEANIKELIADYLNDCELNNELSESFLEEDVAVKVFVGNKEYIFYRAEFGNTVWTPMEVVPLQLTEQEIVDKAKYSPTSERFQREKSEEEKERDIGIAGIKEI
jgi:hypothetical protein